MVTMYILDASVVFPCKIEEKVDQKETCESRDRADTCHGSIGASDPDSDAENNDICNCVVHYDT